MCSVHLCTVRLFTSRLYRDPNRRRRYHYKRRTFCHNGPQYIFKTPCSVSVLQYTLVRHRQLSADLVRHRKKDARHVFIALSSMPNSSSTSWVPLRQHPVRTKMLYEGQRLESNSSTPNSDKVALGGQRLVNTLFGPSPCSYPRLLWGQGEVIGYGPKSRPNTIGPRNTARPVRVRPNKAHLGKSRRQELGYSPHYLTISSTAHILGSCPRSFQLPTISPTTSDRRSAVVA